MNGILEVSSAIYNEYYCFTLTVSFLFRDYSDFILFGKQNSPVSIVLTVYRNTCIHKYCQVIPASDFIILLLFNLVHNRCMVLDMLTNKL